MRLPPSPLGEGGALPFLGRARWAVVLAVLIVGCKGPDDDTEPAVVPKAVAFEGAVDAKYAGTWESADKTSLIDLAKDGKLKIDSTTNSVNGKATSHVEGVWLASDEGLRFKYPDSSGGETILGYVAVLAGEKLTLQQKGGRLKTTYVRK